MRRVTSASPSITQAEIDLVSEAIRDGWHERRNFYIDQFVEEFSDYIGIEYCLPTAHGTDAIHLAMLAFGIGPGDEVIVPDLTWVASVAPIMYVGATPVFVDVDPLSWCVTAESIERNISPKTKAVVVVDLLGNMPEWNEIRDLCLQHNLRIIEDSAEGLGATYAGNQAGTFGEVGLFSFNATKLVMAGQGGALCTNNADLFQHAKLQSHHGIDDSHSNRYYWSTVLGFNYNWTNLQAALALAQLRRIEDLLAHKKWLFDEYQKRLGGFEGLQFNAVGPNVEPTYWISTVILDQQYGLEKEQVCLQCAEQEIDIRPLFYPVSSMPPFREYTFGRSMAEENPVTYFLSKYGVCLPNGNNLDLEDVEYICEVFTRILQNC